MMSLNMLGPLRLDAGKPVPELGVFMSLAVKVLATTSGRIIVILCVGCCSSGSLGGKVLLGWWDYIHSKQQMIYFLLPEKLAFLHI